MEGVSHYGKVVFPGHWRGLGTSSALHKDLRKKCFELVPKVEGMSWNAGPPTSHNAVAVKEEAYRVEGLMDGLWEEARRKGTPKEVAKEHHKQRGKISGEPD